MRRLSQQYFSLASSVDRALNARIHGLVGRLLHARPPGITDLIPGYASLLVEYDEGLVSGARVRRMVERGLADAEQEPATADGDEGGRLVEIPVVYDGPDLYALADAVGLSPAEVVRRHAGVDYRAYAVGFTPGFAFLGDVDPAIRRPRLENPRAHVPAGAIGIADAQTGVYPLASPGGWNLVGRAVTSVYDPRRPQPNLLRAGDTVRFVPVESGAPLPPPRPLELLPAEPRHPAWRVHEAGLLDLVVDEGRFMAGRLGFARSGPLDAASARIANGLVANRPGAPLLEINVLGPTLEALRDVVVAFAGAGVSLHVNGVAAAPYTSMFVRRGQVLTFPPAAHGRRGYLAVAGGVDSATFMGSASVDVRGLIGRPLAAGDVLGVREPRLPRAGFSFVPHFRPTETLRLRLLPGPQHDPGTLERLADRPLRVEHSDRMGVRLSSSGARGGGVLSEGNPLGAVQLTAGGEPLILLNDRGTMGGYAKPALVDPRHLPRLAQARDGTWIRFVVDA